MTEQRARRGRLSKITESWDTPADRQQWDLARQRYSMAARLTEGRAVAEIGCGTGFGLAQLAPLAKQAIGIDIDQDNLRIARARAPECLFVRGDAAKLPFGERSLDALFALEMLYYLPSQTDFLREAARVLRTGGDLLITLPNSRRRHFQKSPLSTHYPDYEELLFMLTSNGLHAKMYGLHPLGDVQPVKEFIRRVLVETRLMPRTIQGRSRLKSLANRGMRPLGDMTLDRASAHEELVPVASASEAAGFAIWAVYCTPHPRP